VRTKLVLAELPFRKRLFAARHGDHTLGVGWHRLKLNTWQLTAEVNERKVSELGQ